MTHLKKELSSTHPPTHPPTHPTQTEKEKEGQEKKKAKGGEEEEEVIHLKKELSSLSSTLSSLHIKLQEKETAVAELQQDKVDLEGKVGKPNHPPTHPPSH